LPELLQLWSSENLEKKIHLIFGASRWQGDEYYNSLHWVYDGNLQHCYDKKHAMLLSERLSGWMNNDFLRSIYFTTRQPITVSCCERIPLVVSQDITCSKDPIVAVINDSLFLASFWTHYIQKLLLLLARFKAIQWQRYIVYVSYAHSAFIDDCGGCKEINE
jgi:hypothetical protein